MQKRKTLLLACLLLIAMLGVLFLSACSGAEPPDKPDYSLRAAEDLYVMSYNIRIQMPTNKTDRWSTRKAALAAHINHYRPDVMGVQEANNAQKKYLLRQLPGYEAVGRSRGKNANSGEGAYIFYRTERLTLLENGHFWLSETPEKSSFGWDADCKRIVIWAKFEDKVTGKTFTHFNTHLDHVGVEAREKGLALILERMEGGGVPQILTGDFNFNENNENYTTVSNILTDTKYAADTLTNAGGSFHAYDETRNMASGSPIDFIFVSKDDFAVREYHILAEKFLEVYTSDHYAVLSVVALK